MTEQILEVCNTTWRTIVALARYGGLRCPSEVLSLQVGACRLGAVQQDARTESEDGTPCRQSNSETSRSSLSCDHYLEAAFEAAADGEEYVVGGPEGEDVPQSSIPGRQVAELQPPITISARLVRLCRPDPMAQSDQGHEIDPGDGTGS